jgi:peroxiredoxin Q/BCP
MAHSADSPYPPEGKKAPAFTAKANDGKTVALKDYAQKKNVVLYFYPRDDTPGCTREACGFRDMRADYDKADTVVLGVSPDSVESHQKFIDKFDLPFLLLADEDKKICEKYGVWQEKSQYGRKYWGIARTTFVIGKDSKLAKVFKSVKPDGHNEKVLTYIQENLD